MANGDHASDDNRAARGLRAGGMARVRHGLEALAVALAITTSGGGALEAAELSPAEARGKTLYTRGVSPRDRTFDADIVGGIRVNASRHPCIQCHGDDGRGGWDAGILTPEIRWSRLSAPYGVPTTLGGVRPTYTEVAVGRAIREGRDSAGDPLDELMPRYAIDDEDLADLVAYLGVLGSEAAPGTSEAAIRVGMLLPLSGPLSDQGRAIEVLLSRYFARVNAAGGIHGREVELVTLDAGGAREPALAAAQRLMEGPEAVFCFLANAGPGASPQILRPIEERGLPLLGPLTFASGSPSHGSIFYLLSSLEDEARAAARFLAGDPDWRKAPIAVVRAEDKGAQEMAHGFEREARQRGLRLVASEELDPLDLQGQTRRLRETGASRIAFFGSATSVQGLLSEASGQKWTPRLLASTVLLGERLSASNGGLLLISPAIAPGVGQRAVADFESLLDAADSPETVGALARGENQAMQMAAFAAARVLTESLKTVGRELSRNRLLEVLRAVRDFETGVMPPISFGPNRRVGARGALILSHDDEGRTVGAEWVEVEDTES